MRRWLIVASILLPITMSKAADVSYFGISKLAEYHQAPGATPIAFSNAFSFVSFAISTNANALTNATVRRSGTTMTNHLAAG